MMWQNRYTAAKPRLLADKTICEANRRLFERFFEHQEYKLKRMNRLSKLDEATYKTLNYYVSRLRTVNRWFANKPWEELARADIKRVYDDVEDGTIKRLSGKPFKGRDSYYNLILCGKPFELAGKAKLAGEVMEFRAPEHPGEVRFIREDTFRRLVDVVIKPEHKAFLWLAWDIGENGGSLLQLRRRDLLRQVDPHTKEPEYTIALRREILKRSRTPRTDITNYKETVTFLDLILRSVDDDGPLFTFGTRMAMKVLDRATRITGAKCIPAGQKITLKDLRSSMACDLLSKDWSTDEVNQRLGHKPSSREIDKYVNWLALDRRRPKRKFHEGQVAELQQRVEELQSQGGLMGQRHQALRVEVGELRGRLEANNRLMYEQLKLVQRIRMKSGTLNGKPVHGDDVDAATGVVYTVSGRSMAPSTTRPDD